MGSFKDSLRTWFYGSGAKAIAATSNVCLLDASGNPIGCDTIQRVSAFVLNPNDFVDMGLPSGRLWAKRNLGALKETDYGYYFSWGNLTGHSEGGGYDFSQAKYDTTDAAAISADLTLAQDAAMANLGKAWRMPTKDEFSELFNSEYTTNTWVSNYSSVNYLNGRLITSKANGNTLFIPAAGRYNAATLEYKSAYCNYWSKSIGLSTKAYGLYSYSSGNNTEGNYDRRFGFSVRPVI